jgi:major vault protein
LKKQSEFGEIVLMDEFGQARLRHGDQEIRFEQDPFPLYPGEKLEGNIQPLQIVEEYTALKLKSKRDFEDRYAKAVRRAGEEWHFKGPQTYYPQPEVEIVATVRAIILKPNQALKLRAKDDCIDYQKTKRKAGEEWLVKQEGAYLPDVNEVVVEVVNAYILTDTNGLHLKAKRTFVDSRGVSRRAGEEWLVTKEVSEAYIPDVNEEVTKQVKITIVDEQSYCVLVNPVGEDGKPQLGVRKLVRGELVDGKRQSIAFFLKPGEELETNAVQQVCLLSPSQAIWVSAREQFRDDKGRLHKAGDQWLVYGPGEYCPPLEVNTPTIRWVRAFIDIEPLNIRLFQPVLFVVYVLLFFVAWFYMKHSVLPMLRGGDANPKTEL